jgi:hypothetical protein
MYVPIRGYYEHIPVHLEILAIATANIQSNGSSWYTLEKLLNNWPWLAGEPQSKTSLAIL